MTKLSFRSPGNNVRLLEGLFFEQTRHADKRNVVYTLKDQDHKGYKSLYRLYMEAEDLSEWHFAEAHLDGYEHWEMLTKCSWFQPYVERWRRELELKIRGRALMAVKEVAADPDNKNTYLANKLLLQGGWKDKDEDAATRRGRPSKADIKKEAESQAEAAKQLQEDLERITLHEGERIN